jgi:hypothetical protein
VSAHAEAASGAPGALDRRDALLAIIVALVAVLAFLPIAYRWFSLLDEGYVLAIADQVNRGRILYRDIWIDNPFPGAATVANATAPSDGARPCSGS